MKPTMSFFLFALLISSFQLTNASGCNAEDLGCHHLAQCEMVNNAPVCSCPPGTYGFDGLDCKTGAWTVRMVLSYPSEADVPTSAPPFSTSLAERYASLLVFGAEGATATSAPLSITWDPTAIADGLAEFNRLLESMVTYTDSTDAKFFVTINGIFGTMQAAADARNMLVFTDMTGPPITWVPRDLEGQVLPPGPFEALANPRAPATVEDTPKVYRWMLETSGAPISVAPTGLEVTSVFFEPSCAETGCWVIDIMYTVGESNFNALYIPKAEARSEANPQYSQAVKDTYFPRNFPCGTEDLTDDARSQACCIQDFVAEYRTLESFIQWSESAAAGLGSCPQSPTYDPEDLPTGNHIEGELEGMPASRVEYTGVFNKYGQVFTQTARLFLDEVELRTLGGMLEGTVGVEHTVDLFVGLAEFKPTGTPNLDSFTKQVAIHLEKTDIMTVASHLLVGPRIKTVCCGPECTVDGTCPNGENVDCRILVGPFAEEDYDLCPDVCWCCGADCEDGVCPEGGNCEIRCDPNGIADPPCPQTICCGADCLEDGTCAANATDCVLKELDGITQNDPGNPCLPPTCCGDCDINCAPLAADSVCRIVDTTVLVNPLAPCAPQYCCGADCEEDGSCPEGGKCEIRVAEAGVDETCDDDGLCCGPGCNADGECPDGAPCVVRLPGQSLADENVNGPWDPENPCQPVTCCGDCDDYCNDADPGNADECRVVTMSEVDVNNPCGPQYCCGVDCKEDGSCNEGDRCQIRTSNPLSTDTCPDSLCCGPDCLPNGVCPFLANCYHPVPGETDPEQPCLPPTCCGTDCDANCEGTDCRIVPASDVVDAEYPCAPRYCCGPDCDAEGNCPAGGDCEERSAAPGVDETCASSICCGKDCLPDGTCPVSAFELDCEIRYPPFDPNTPCVPPTCCGDCDENCNDAGLSADECTIVPADEILNPAYPCAPKYCCGPGCGADGSCSEGGEPCEIRQAAPGAGEVCDDTLCCGPDCKPDGTCPAGGDCREVSPPLDPSDPCLPPTCCGDCNADCTDAGESADECTIIPADEILNPDYPCAPKYCCGPECGADGSCADGALCEVRQSAVGVTESCEPTICCGDDCVAATGFCPSGGDCFIVSPTDPGFDPDAPCAPVTCCATNPGDCNADCSTSNQANAVCTIYTDGSELPAQCDCQGLCCPGNENECCGDDDCKCTDPSGCCDPTTDCCGTDAATDPACCTGECCGAAAANDPCCLNPADPQCDSCSGECCPGTTNVCCTDPDDPSCDECTDPMGCCDQTADCCGENANTGDCCQGDCCGDDADECCDDPSSPSCDSCSGECCPPANGEEPNPCCEDPELPECTSCTDPTGCCDPENAGTDCCDTDGCCVGDCCGAAANDPCCVDPTAEGCDTCSGECCPGSADVCCTNPDDPSCDQCTDPKGCCDPETPCCGDDADSDECCQGDCCGDSPDPCCDPSAEGCDECKGACCPGQLLDECCANPNHESCSCTDPTGCCDPDQPCCGDNANDPECCTGDCCGDDQDDCCDDPSAEGCDSCTGECCPPDGLGGDLPNPCCLNPDDDSCQCTDPMGCCDPTNECCGDNADPDECCDGACCGSSDECCTNPSDDTCCTGDCCDPASCEEGPEPMISNVNIRLYEVLDFEDPSLPPYQYAQVTVVIGGEFDAHDTTGATPESSILVAKGQSKSRAAHFQACGNDGLEGVPANANAYTARFGQECAPSALMCESPTSLPDQLISVNVPLGVGFFTDDDLGGGNGGEQSIFVDTVVALVHTPTGGISRSNLKFQIPITRAGSNVFCDSVFEQVELRNMVNVDLIVGSGVTSAELDRLRIFENLASTDLVPKAPTEFDTDSIESGLMTLVVSGNSSFFNLPNTGSYSVEIEDIITLHFMEPGSSSARYAAVTALLTPPQTAFTVEINTVTKRAYLEPTTLLTDQCKLNPRPASQGSPLPETCVLRRDMKDRIAPVEQGAGFKTAMEIGVASADVEGFMSSIFGGSEYTEALGTSYEGVLQARYTLNGRWTRAWWINPGYEWTPAVTGGTSKFSLSQRIVLFVLLAMDESGGTSAPYPTGVRRVHRRLLASGVDGENGNGLGNANLQFDVKPEDLFEVPAEAFRIKTGISTAQACKPQAELVEDLEALAKDKLAAQGVTAVSVNSVTVDFDGHVCGDSRRLLASPTAQFDAMCLFEAGTTPALDFTKIDGFEGVSLSPVNNPGDGIVKGGEKTDDKDEGGSSSNVGVIVGAVVGAVIVVALAAGIFVMKKRSAAGQVPSAQASVVDTLKVQPTVVFDKDSQFQSEPAPMPKKSSLPF
eukprot:CAMPEP_0181316116 /NCGR_PEP_ID=MMETSP1101-20121128/15724_1 /TAXON_ID=46948 /ORGANISM="Rhodomonas abbreviata, Strain Caron Lab Isolate" /LENGTH=2299 /DNA_ID=CAMNT_0023423343 /DNA_START=79 /DNA_END=6978 /DNA_ORIENTATION=-